MITIKETSKEFTEVEQYLMTLSSDITSMKDVADGTSIEVAGTLLFVDTKETGTDAGKEVEILSIITPDNEVYSCQSATFKRSMGDISKIMHGQPFSIIKKSGTTKAGRPYIDCALDITKLATKSKK